MVFDPASTPDGKDPPTHRKLVLVVEDEHMIGALIEDILKDAAFDVVLADDPRKAVELARTLPQLSAVVADIHLGEGQDGRLLLRQLRTGRPQLPAVVLTDYDRSTSSANLRGLGGPTARLDKPFSAEDLVASVNDVLTSMDGRAGRRIYRMRMVDPAEGN